MKILVTGSNGYVGSSLCKLLADVSDFEIVKHNRSIFDLANQQAVRDHFKCNEYDVVIHAAATGGSRLKTDDAFVLYNNLSCFYNLYENKDRFGKLITFGSGSEFDNNTTPYNLSKRCINAQIQTTKNFYNLRIYAVFNEDELDTRFIKSNLLRYIKKQPLIVYQNKVMDFFAMSDLAEVVKYYCINKDSALPVKVVDCCYDKKHSLIDIAKYINSLSNYACDIQVEKSGMNDDYIGFSSTMPSVAMTGLFPSINNMYNKLKEMHESFYSRT